MIGNLRNIKTLLLTCVSIFSLIGSVLAQENLTKFQDKVLSVENGNSLLLQIDERKLSFTFYGISAVENEQPTGKQSRDSLARMLKDKQVTFVPAKKLDLTKENFSSGKVFLDEQDIALRQLNEGLVYITKEGRDNFSEEDKKLYGQAEQRAFEKRLGLWNEDYRCKGEVIKDRISGSADVEIIIDESGNVVQAKAICGNPIFRSAAVKAALKSKFKPTTLAGIVVRVKGTIKYNFKH